MSTTVRDALGSFKPHFDLIYDSDSADKRGWCISFPGETDPGFDLVTKLKSEQFLEASRLLAPVYKALHGLEDDLLALLDNPNNIRALNLGHDEIELFGGLMLVLAASLPEGVTSSFGPDERSTYLKLKHLSDEAMLVFSDPTSAGLNSPKVFDALEVVAVG